MNEYIFNSSPAQIESQFGADKEINMPRRRAMRNILE
jgi:hypothetical protein